MRRTGMSDRTKLWIADKMKSLMAKKSLDLDVIDVKSAALNISSMKQEYLSSQAINNITSVKTCREVVDELNILA